MSEKADFEPSLKRASHFVKIIVACPHRLPKLPESTLRKQARPNNGSLFYSHCASSIQLTQYQLARRHGVYGYSKTEGYCLSRLCFEMTSQRHEDTLSIELKVRCRRTVYYTGSSVVLWRAFNLLCTKVYIYIYIVMTHSGQPASHLSILIFRF
jgi:hypothetical protein